MPLSVKRRLVGVAPLILNNGRLANPLDDFAKALKKITQKRHKTDADFEEVAKIEWYGSLYLKHGNICIPGAMVDACLINAAKKLRKGIQAKAGLFSLGDWPLEYDGPSDIDTLWEDGRCRFTTQCRPQSKATVMRTRPRFEEWAIDVEIAFNPDVLNASDIDEFLRIGGRDCGLGNWRPRFGRFEVQTMA